MHATNRLAGLAFLLAAMLVSSSASRAQPEADPDPKYDGKKPSAWIDILQNDASARQRALAATALAQLRLKHRVKDLHKDLGRSLRVDSSAAVRTQCAIVIGKLKAADVKEIESELVEALKAEKVSRVRKQLAIIMGQYPEIAKRSVESLTGVLKDSDPAARAAAADALAKLGPGAKEAANGLLPLLNDQDRAARQKAIFALGRIAPENSSFVAAALVKRLGAEKSPELRREVIISLKLLGDKSETTVGALASALNDADNEVAAAAVETLGAFGAAARPAAEAILKLAASGKDKGLRIGAVRAFGSALGPDLKERLKDMIAIMEKDGDFEVRVAAVEEVGALGPLLVEDKDTLAALRKRKSDPQVKVREAAAAAIRRIEKKPEKNPAKKPFQAP